MTTIQTFPIQELLPDIRASLSVHPRLVLEAPPGAGKTTQVPLALLDAPWLAGRAIVLLEPRRVAARAAAAFMARQLGESVGETIGYRIRFDSKVSARTRIVVVTEGILTRMLQDDPMLGDGTPAAVGALLFDEFHERHLAGDLGLAMALDVQSGLREDLRIVVMSATLDGERLAQRIDAPRLSSAGRAFPVTIAHLPPRREETSERHVARAVVDALATHPGDVLVFLPGRREIVRVEVALSALQQASFPSSQMKARIGKALRGAQQSLDSPQPPPNLPLLSHGEERRSVDSMSQGEKRLSVASASPQEVQIPEDSSLRASAQNDSSRRSSGDAITVLALHGDLPVEQQALVLQPDPHGRRRVVLATNVAESSVTLPGVRVVVDTGQAREPRFDPNSGFSRLDVVTVSQASADQRAGRAGRVAEGWAYRLWPESRRLEPQRRPEIAQVELAGLALELAAWGSADLQFVDVPPPGALAAARDLLRALGAIDAGDLITALGRRMLALGTHPRLAAMLVSADGGADAALACDLAALLEARDPLFAGPGMPRSDALVDRWRALAAFRNGRPPREASRSALAAIAATATQWRRRLRVDRPPPANLPAHALGDRLAQAFPDRIAHRHASDRTRYQLANGRTVQLFDDSTLVGEPWLVVSELRDDVRDARVMRAAPVDEQHLRARFVDQFSDRDETRWDANRRALVAERVQRFAGIVLDVRSGGRVDPSAAAHALTDAVRDLGLDALPWTQPLQQWRARVRSLHAWLQPEPALPDLSDAALLATLDDWLRPAFSGLTRLDALAAHTFAEALKTLLDWPQRQRIETLAPSRIDVPSGMSRGISYAIDADGTPVAPVLAVKLQELFGLADTPRIVDGRIALTLHLLSPGGRPLQVTQDLRGFWERTYPDVRKEMKGRYPKHPWPEDPWSAAATHRAKPRGS